tara:strand:+ start:34 stop:150 length:117 start_codon:yes stop_codon:yes gene_type:complete
MNILEGFNINNLPEKFWRPNNKQISNYIIKQYLKSFEF